MSAFVVCAGLDAVCLLACVCGLCCVCNWGRLAACVRGFHNAVVVRSVWDMAVMCADRGADCVVVNLASC